MTTRKSRQEANEKTTQPECEKTPAYIGPPITQDEIDAKRRKGQNASGLTSPLPGIIPTEHFIELEARALGLPNGNGHLTHYNHSTRNAPLFIDATIEQFSQLLGDELGNTARNINRTAKLYRTAQLGEEEFREAMHEAFTQATRYPEASIKKKRSDGQPNRMPVFFTILAECLTSGGHS